MTELADLARLAETTFRVFEGQAGVPVQVSHPSLGMAYAIPSGTESTVVDDYAPWTPAAVKQVFYRESDLLGVVLIEAQLIMRWRCSAAGQYIINAAFAVDVLQQDATTDVTIDVVFDSPAPFDVELEAYEIPFHVTVLYDPVGDSSTTVLDGYIRADGSGRFDAE